MTNMIWLLLGFALAKLDSKYGSTIGYKLGKSARAAIAKATE